MSTATFHIGPVRSVVDLASVGRLFDAYTASLGIDLSYQDYAVERTSLPARYAPPAGELLLARNPAGDAIGCVGLRPLEADGLCEMKRLYVTPQGRGLGLGRALVQKIIETAERIGYREMRLDTLPDMTAAIALYRARGFRPIAPYYDTPVPGTIFLARRLAP